MAGSGPNPLTLSTGGPSRPVAPLIFDPTGTPVSGWDTLTGAAAVNPDGSLLASAAGQTSMLSALNAIKVAIQAQIQLANLFLTDNGSPAKYYVRREQVNEGTGVVSVVIENLDGTIPGTAPTGLVPITAAAAAAPGASYTSEAQFFDVKAVSGGRTDYAVGDVLALVVIVNTSTSALTRTYQNLTKGTTLTTIWNAADAVETTSSNIALLQGILSALQAPLATQIFTVLRPANNGPTTVRQTVGTSASTALAMPTLPATSYRVCVPAAAANPVTFILTTDNTKVPIIPTPYATNGTGGALGDKTIDPGGVEVIGLNAAQQAAAAAGTLYLVAISTGASEISVTLGTGA